MTWKKLAGRCSRAQVSYRVADTYGISHPPRRDTRLRRIQLFLENRIVSQF